METADFPASVEITDAEDADEVVTEEEYRRLPRGPRAYTGKVATAYNYQIFYIYSYAG